MEHNPLQDLKDPDLRPRLDQGSWNFTPSQAATTAYAPSTANTSDDPQHRDPAAGSNDDGGSILSRYSYRSEIDADRFIRYIGGRRFNALNDAYLFPTGADNDEWIRLNKEHVTLFLALGELYPAAEQVRAILKPVPGETKSILDLGCGAGVWAIEMAYEFPDANVVGVDLAPIPVEPNATPPNCRFEIDDINLGLEHFKEAFDIVHVRLVEMGIQDFRKTMADVHRCLKPGGIALWACTDSNIYAEDMYSRVSAALDEDEDNPDQTERSWLQRVSDEVKRGMVMGMSDIDGMQEAMDRGLWEEDMMDPETCGASSLYLPIGPWVQGRSQVEADRLGYVGALVRQYLMIGVRSSHEITTRLGFDLLRMEKWSDLTEKQMMEMKPKTWYRVRYAWGRRRAAEDEPAPPLTIVAEAAPLYPHHHVYRTREEAHAAASRRNRYKDCAPPAPPEGGMHVEQATISASTPS